MNIGKKLANEENERAVSPVIGVILMVAITVILAAVIATFVMDIGDLDKGAPNAQYEWESENGNTLVTWTHQSGNAVDRDALTASVTIEDDNGDLYTKSEELEGDDITASDSIEFETDDGGGSSDVYVTISNVASTGNLDYSSDVNNNIESIEEVTVTWSADESSSIIAEWEA